MRGSGFEFDGVNLMYYDFNKISLNRGGSYIDSPEWIKDKRSTITLKIKTINAFNNLRYRIQKEIPVVFPNGSTYDYHFIIKELVKTFDGNFECLGENTEKYIKFSVPIKKEIKNKNKIIEITYKIKFIDSFRFMSTSLSKLVDNLSEGLHNNRCVDCKSCLNYMKTKDVKLTFRCFNCKKNYEKDFNKDLIKRFANIYEFCNGNLNKFIN